MRTRLSVMSQPARLASPKAMDFDSRPVRQRFDLKLARSPTTPALNPVTIHQTCETMEVKGGRQKERIHQPCP